MITAIRGMNDILPAEIPQWRFVEETARRIFGLYGFGELRTPVMERSEVFLRGIGSDTDVVEKQMYTFEDKSGTSNTLRPEATASVIRAVIEHGMLGQDPIVKLFSIGPMFRYERPQKGRYRQFHQINVERLGEESPQCDAETLAMAYDLAVAVGLDGVTMEVNSLGCNECRPRYKKALQEYLAAHEEKLCGDCARRMHTNPLRVIDCKVDGCKEVVAQAPSLAEYLCDDCRTHHEEVLAGLDVLGVRYEQNPLLVRGLDYYTRTTFEITATNLGSQNAVAGGGRYDGLVKTLGGPDVPGVGFAFGFERLVMLLGERAEEKAGCYVVMQQDEAVKRYGLGLMQELRQAGVAVEAVPEKSFKAQMKRAGKSGYPLCAILGADEAAGGTVALKDLRESRQESFARAEAVKKIVNLIETGETL